MSVPGRGLYFVRRTGGLLPPDPDRVLPEPAGRIGKVYWHADHVSQKYSRRSRRALTGLLCLALTGTLGFEIFAHLLTEHIVLWLVYPAALALAWILYRLTLYGGIESRYLDYRALAEALRVQFFWILAGDKESVADHYLAYHRSELDWIRYALRSLALFFEAGTVPDEERFRLIRAGWVEDQRNWFGDKWKQQKKFSHRLTLLSGKSLVVVWMLSLVIPLSLILPYAPLGDWQALGKGEPWLGALLLLTSLPSLFLGFFRVWMEQGGYEEQARTYHRMESIFTQADKKLGESLQAVGDGAGREAALREAGGLCHRLGIEALEENGYWLLMHRERPLKVVS